MKDIKVVVFDCDGVLFNTEKANMAYYNQILTHFGRSPMTSDQLAYVNMYTVDDALAFLFDKDMELIMKAQIYRKTMSYHSFISHMEIEPYLKPLLKKLRPRFKTAIATNRTDTMDSVLDEHELEGCFDLVVSALDVERPKPYPDSLIKVLEYFKIIPSNAIYIGDSKLDEIAAKAVEIRLIAYNNSSLSADFHIKSLNEIEDIMRIKG